jgi:predicted metalloprotease with PDZ domain
LQQHSYTQNGVKFYLWFQGECKPDWKLLETDFRKFSKAQIEKFGDFPVEEYHFLFQILTHRTFHGVEHYNSTVISLGPSYDIMNKDGWYKELLGVSSHELYHTWNVKQIRPTEMLPYDYAKENYTELGYLTEGVTTYFGDKFLLSSSVFNWSEYAKTFNQLLERHFNNFGTHNYSVAQSSFDTWLDGYVIGIPGRKSSIYTEGALVAFMTDIFILKNTKNKKSLNDVMKILYNDFSKKEKGVSDTAFKTTVEKVAGVSYHEIYNSFLHGTEAYTYALKSALNYIGCDLKVETSIKFNEAYIGFKVRYENDKCIVNSIFPESIADKNGFTINDELIAVNGIKINKDLTQWTQYFNKEEMTFTVKRALGTLESIKIKVSDSIYFRKYTITKSDSDSASFKAWSE